MRPRTVFLRGFLFLLCAVLSNCLGKVADDGRDIFVANGCYECHGYKGEGSRLGPPIAPGPLPLKQFVDMVQSPYGVMPAYPPRVLSTENLKLIHTYLLSIKEPPKVRT